MAGFIFGGSGRRALLVARDGQVWSGPAFYNLATASVGFQAGVEVSEAIIVVMTEKGLNSPLSNSFKVGGDRVPCLLMRTAGTEGSSQRRISAASFRSPAVSFSQTDSRIPAASFFVD